jgi:hypothetical protein
MVAQYSTAIIIEYQQRRYQFFVLQKLIFNDFGRREKERTSTRDKIGLEELILHSFL